MAPTRTRHVPSALLIKLGAAFLRIGRSGNERTRIPPVCGALLRRIDAAHEGLAPHSHPRKQTHKTYTPRLPYRSDLPPPRIIIVMHEKNGLFFQMDNWFFSSESRNFLISSESPPHFPLRRSCFVSFARTLIQFSNKTVPMGIDSAK
jgi:hypothetical protein